MLETMAGLSPCVLVPRSPPPSPIAGFTRLARTLGRSEKYMHIGMASGERVSVPEAACEEVIDSTRCKDLRIAPARSDKLEKVSAPE